MQSSPENRVSLARHLHKENMLARICAHRPELTCDQTHTEESVFVHIQTSKREKWFSPGTDRVSSFLPAQFICCLKHYTEGVSPCIPLHTHTHTGETKPFFSTLLLSITPVSTLHLLISPSLSLFPPPSRRRPLPHTHTHSCRCNVTMQHVNIPEPCC